MNKIRRITVVRSFLLDFFFDLRRAIAFPPTAHSKKERPRPIVSGEARQSPDDNNEPGRKKCRPGRCIVVQFNWRFLPTVQYNIPGQTGYVKIKSL